MIKDELREQALLHRDKIRPEDEDAEQASVLLRENVPTEGKIVAAYWPAGNEFDVRYIIDDLLKAGVSIALLASVLLRGDSSKRLRSIAGI